MLEHTIDLLKTADRQINVDRLHRQVDEIVDRIHTASRKARGWSARRGSAITDQKDDEIFYHIRLTLSCTKEQNDVDLPSIIEVIEKAGNGSRWQIVSVDSQPKTPSKKNISYVDIEIPDNWQDHFSHLFGLEDQISIAMSSIQAAIDSEWQNRFHCAFVGEPASGKSATAEAFRTIFGEEAVLKYDATSTTMAGAIKDLDQRDALPRILIVEEIEKADEASFRWLLGVLDWRAEIRKVNFKQFIHRETRMLGIVTVNDYNHFSKLMSGALASRCGDPIWFPKPSREVLQKILEREVSKVAGDPRWIEPTLDYAARVDMFDPRHVTAICLRGKEKLLTGEYQQQLMNVRMPNV